MRVIAWDTETALIRPARNAPELVCVTWQERGQDAQICHWTEALHLLRGWLLDPDVVLVGHNVAYDMAVIGAQFPDLVPAIFDAYEANRVTDTMLRQCLLDIAAGCYRGRFGRSGKWIQYDYDLAAVARRALGITLEKDEWRLRYAEFRDVANLSDWPEGARQYPLNDAIATFGIWEKQEEHAEYIQDQYRQARNAFWLHLTSTWGLRTDADSVERLKVATLERFDRIREDLIEAGLVRNDAKGSRDTKAAARRMVEVCAEEGRKIRLTDKGVKLEEAGLRGLYDGVCLDSEACESTDDEILKAYSEYSGASKVFSTDIPMLAAGTVVPIHTRFGLAASDRSTSSKPNVQNPRRLPGIREAFRPRTGHVFANADIGGLELCTLAQSCIVLLGRSALADAINSGKDPHTLMAASILGIDYADAERRKDDANDQEFDNVRQTCKVANFGFPGGLGYAKLCLFAKKTYKVTLTPDDTPGTGAKWLKTRWLEMWPEMREYFAHVAALCDADEDGLATIQQFYTGRYRGGCTYTAACNGYFQELGAVATKYAGWLISKATYAQPESVLFGSRLVNYVHDEFFLETPDTPCAHDVAMEMGRLFLEGVNRFLPDVPAKTKPLLTRMWSKKAKPVYGSDGRLVPWEPKEKAA